MKKLFIVCVAMFILTACSNDTATNENNELTPEKAEEKGNVVVIHKGNSFDEIVKGNIDVNGMDKMNSFLKNVEAKQNDSISISIFDSNGGQFENKLSYEDEKVVFENNYGGYKQAPKGTFTCDYIMQRGPMVYLESCTGKDGKEMSTILSFIAKESDFK